ncbi:MAG: endonuclease/exonuclease/phosphatase family protein [Nocardioidaceae bacterium]
MRPVRVATYNVYLGCDLSMVFGVTDDAELGRRVAALRAQLEGTDFPARARSIAAVLVRERVDLAGLQEVARWTRDGEVWLDFLTELLDALAALGEPYDAHALAGTFHGGSDLASGETVAVLGRNVVLRRRSSPVAVVGEGTGRFAAAMHLDTAGTRVTIDATRGYGWVDAELDGRRFRLVNTHTEAWDGEARTGQRDELVAAVGDPGLPVLVTGDFNTPPDSVGMPPAYVDAWAVAGEGDGFTYGQDVDLANEHSGMRRRIDYVFVRDATVAGARVVGDRQADRTASGLWPSDHAALVVDVQLA